MAVPSAAGRIAPSPPEPSRLFGHLRAFASDPLGFLDNIRENYDEAVRMRFVNISTFTFIQPEAVRHIFQDNHTNYSKDMYDFHLLGRVLGNGLVTNEGPGWLRQRRLIQPAFARRRMGSYAQVMMRCIDDFAAEWRAKDGQVVDVAEEMMRLTLRIVGLALFSKDLLAEAETLGVELTRANRLLTRRILSGYPEFLYGPLDLRLALSARRLRRGVMEMIAERESERGRTASGGPGGGADDASAPPEDLLATLLAARDGESAQPMSREQIRDEVLTLLLAGHETTANTLAWTLHLLGANPAANATLSEAASLLPKDRSLTPDDVSRAPYVGMAVKESMRLRPAVWSVGRRVVADDIVGGFHVPAGSIVFASQYVTHRHPTVWEDPLRFLPERFLPEAEKKLRPYAFFPFGGGPRLCIGQEFALVEAGLILARIARDFTLTPESGSRVEPEPLITLRPRGGVRMRIGVR